MRHRMGPVLYAGKSTADEWCFSVAVLLEADADEDRTRKVLELTVDDAGARVSGPTIACDFKNDAPYIYVRWDVSVPRAGQSRYITYVLKHAGGETVEGMLPETPYDHVCIPGADELPRIAFFSCNGFSSAELARKTSDPQVLWKQIHKRQRGSAHEAFHLMIGGGDQIYADSLWYTNARLAAIREKSHRKQADAKPPGSFAGEILRDYIKLYITRWGQAWFSAMLARIPGFYTWDDHDIFDGWGSYDTDLQNSPYFEQVFKAASTTFKVFQLGHLTKPTHVICPQSYLQVLDVPSSNGLVSIVALDLRSARTKTDVLGAEQWKSLKDWLGKVPEGKRRQVFLVSSIPLVYMRFNVAEWLLDMLPGAQEIEDDLHDQWESQGHRWERNRLIMTLLGHMKSRDCGVTVLSGDVHIGARARIVCSRPDLVGPNNRPLVIEQVTSSGIVHPAPTPVQWMLIKSFGAEGRDTLEPGIESELLPVSRGREYLCRRNWLMIESQASGPYPVRYSFQWMTTDGPIEEKVYVY